MPYLRCEECEAKALPIATRCPSCEHPFDSAVREKGRLRSCGECDSLISRDARECRWCGEAVSKAPPRALVLAGAAATLVALLGGGWWMLGPEADRVSPSSPSATVQQPGPAGTPEVESGAVPESEADESAASVALAEAPDEPAEALDTPESDPPAGDDSSPAELDGQAETDLVPETTGEGWIRAVARTFVNIRTSPGSDAEVRGVVAENDVVLLGTARGDWREVRSGELAGWAWEPLFSVGGGSD